MVAKAALMNVFLQAVGMVLHGDLLGLIGQPHCMLFFSSSLSSISVCFPSLKAQQKNG